MAHRLTFDSLRTEFVVFTENLCERYRACIRLILQGFLERIRCHGKQKEGYKSAEHPKSARAGELFACLFDSGLGIPVRGEERWADHMGIPERGTGLNS